MKTSNNTYSPQIFLFAICALTIFAGCAVKKPAQTNTHEIIVPQKWSENFSVSTTNPKSTGKPHPKKIIQAKLKPNSKNNNSKYWFVGPPLPPPFEVGEQLKFSVSWLGVRLGDCLIEVNPYTFVGKNKAYEFKFSLKTSTLASLFYSADDWAKAQVDVHSFLPSRFELHGIESKHERKGLELYDHSKNKMYINHYDKIVKTGELRHKEGERDLIPGSLDGLSAIYFLRMQKVTPEKSVRFPFIAEGNQQEIEIRHVAYEKLDTNTGEFNAQKLALISHVDGKKQYNENSHVWISNDEKRILLRFEAKVKIGTIAGEIKEIGRSL